VPEEVRVFDAGDDLVLFESREDVAVRHDTGARWTVAGDPKQLDLEGAQLVLVGVGDEPEKLGIDVLEMLLMCHSFGSPSDSLMRSRSGMARRWRAPAHRRTTVRGAERLRAWHEGFSLHAGVVIAEHDRDALERLCRYGARPAFAQERLAWTDDGRIAYRLKRPWPDGRTELVLPPVAFLRRLCGIIPPRRRHLVRYSGVFGPAAKPRAATRARPRARPHPAGTLLRRDRLVAHGPAAVGRPAPPRVRRRCPAMPVWRASQRARRHRRPRGRTLLVALGLPHEPTAFAPARDPPQLELEWDDPS
jgi:hypothetical protein